MLFIWISNVKITSNENMPKIVESDSKVDQTFCPIWKSLHTNTWNNNLLTGNEGYYNNNTEKLRNYSKSIQIGFSYLLKYKNVRYLFYIR